MAAYMIVQIAIHDEAQFMKYREAVAPLLTRHGARTVVQRGIVEVLEGHQDGRRMAMFEFASMAALDAFWTSPEYVAIKQLRRDAATLDVWAVEGA